MAVSYRDDTPFDDSDHTMKQIAEAIRHKKYGKDVREAIAQGFELLNKKQDKINNFLDSYHLDEDNLSE